MQILCGTDPDFAKRDLYKHIASGKEAGLFFSTMIHLSLPFDVL